MAVSILQRTIPRMIDIELQLDDNLKNVAADAGQCEQILMNLCINAQHAMKDGGSIQIDLKEFTHQQNSLFDTHNNLSTPFAILSISDTGTGMSEEIQKIENQNSIIPHLINVYDDHPNYRDIYEFHQYEIKVQLSSNKLLKNLILSSLLFL